MAAVVASPRRSTVAGARSWTPYPLVAIIPAASTLLSPTGRFAGSRTRSLLTPGGRLARATARKPSAPMLIDRGRSARGRSRTVLGLRTGGRRWAASRVRISWPVDSSPTELHPQKAKRPNASFDLTRGNASMRQVRCVVGGVVVAFTLAGCGDSAPESGPVPSRRRIRQRSRRSPSGCPNKPRAR